MLTHYQNQSCPEAVELLRRDAVTYSVLIQILQTPCTDIYTDRERVIVCYSCPPFPVWVWCAHPENARDIREIAGCLKEAFPMEAGFTYNLSHVLLDRLREADPCFRDTSVKMELLSYRLDRIAPLDRPCDGAPSRPREEEVAYLAEIWHDLAYEMEGRVLTPDQCVRIVGRKLDTGTLFLWRSPAGKIAALTARNDEPPYSKVGAVYTLPEYRRRGYALHLVHRVTEGILAEGLTPILYTNADYPASNACYQKIGYRPVGSLCTVGK